MIQESSQQLGTVISIDKNLIPPKTSFSVKQYLQLNKKLKLTVTWENIEDKDLKKVLKSYKTQGLYIKNDSISVGRTAIKFSIAEPLKMLTEINKNQNLIAYLKKQPNVAIISTITGEVPEFVEKDLLQANEVYLEEDDTHDTLYKIVLYRETEELSSYYLTEGNWFSFEYSRPCWVMVKGKPIIADWVSNENACPKGMQKNINKLNRDNRFQLLEN